MINFLYISLVLFFSMFVLVACCSSDEAHIKIANSLERITNVEYDHLIGNHRVNVTEDVILQQTFDGYPEASVTWKSSNKRVITVDGDQGIVTRSSKRDEKVTQLIRLVLPS